jgi:hypothetical protein
MKNVFGLIYNVTNGNWVKLDAQRQHAKPIYCEQASCKICPWGMTLSFDLVKWFLRVTSRLMMLNIYARLFDSDSYGGIMVQTN